MGCFRVSFMVIVFMICCNSETFEAALSKSEFRLIKKVNKGGPYTGLLVSRSSELQPFFNSPRFRHNSKIPHVDLSGRRFHIGHIGDRKMVVVMTGKGMINAAITTQILCSLFKIKYILHYGLANNADDNLNIGDITIPEYWAHTGFWNWQRYGDGPDDELSFEENGYFTRDYGYLKFADYTNTSDFVDEDYSPDNFLNKIWYQPEEIFPTDGLSPDESKDSVFWIPTPTIIFELAKKLEAVKLEECINDSTCLPNTPKVVTVKRGSSASIYLDNIAYKTFLNSKFEVSPVDMEGAAIALISHQHRIPFLAFKALHDEISQEEILISSTTKSSSFNDDNKDDDDTEEMKSKLFLLMIENCVKVTIEFMIKYSHINYDNIPINFS